MQEFSEREMYFLKGMISDLTSRDVEVSAMSILNTLSALGWKTPIEEVPDKIKSIGKAMQYLEKEEAREKEEALQKEASRAAFMEGWKN